MKIIGYIILITLIMGCSQKDLTRKSKKVYGIKNLDSLFKKVSYLDIIF